MIIVLPLRFFCFILFSLAILVKVDVATFGCSLGLTVFAFRVTPLGFLLIPGPVTESLGISRSSFSLSIGLPRGWLCRRGRAQA